MKHLPLEGESGRLEALHAYGILDTPPEASFEHITSLVRRLFGVPIAAVTLVDADRQWFKSMQGLDIRETSRDISFCARAMHGDEMLVVSDATLDPRFADNPQVKGAPGIRFYAGAPLRTPEGHPLGALCMIDLRPRQFSAAELQTLAELASLVEDELLLRRMGNQLRAETNQRQEVRAAPEHSFRQIVEQADEAFFVYDLEGNILDVNAAACALVGYEREELLCLRVDAIEISFDLVAGPTRWLEMVAGQAVTLEGLNRRKDGSVFPAEARVSVVETGAGRRLLALVRDISARKQAEGYLLARARQQQAIAKFGAGALSGGGLDDLLDESVLVIGDILELPICRVLEHAPESGELITRTGLNLPSHERGLDTGSASARFAAGYVFSTGVPVIIKDVRTEQVFSIAPWVRATGAVSGLTVPIGSGDGSVARYGVLIAFSREPREFTEDDVYFAQSIANVLAAAIVRQSSEDALRVVEARYQRIATNTPGMVYQYLRRPDGRIVVPFVSEGCRMIYGLEPQEIYDHPQVFLERVHPAEKSRLMASMNAAEASLVPLHWEGRFLRPDGEVRWMRVDSRPERLPDGAVMCDGIMIDITAQKQSEEALRQSEERFRLANLHSPFPIMLHADDGEVLQVNDAWTRPTGYSPQELVTVEDWIERAYLDEPGRNEAWHSLAQLPPDVVGAIQRGARRIRCANGEERRWDISHVNLGRLPDGRHLRITTAVDVTERHQGEVALRQAKEEAERANAAKSEFLSRMSHELRTPLNAILGFGQLLALGQNDEADAQSIEHILKGGRHLLALINEVLDLARVESGELVLTRSAVRFDELARECVGFVARMAQARGITCTVEICSECQIPVMADEQRLRQVLLNLLANAIKYNHDGGRVEMSCDHQSPGHVRLKIRDSGPGISAENLARLFVPFERLGQEFGKVEGTGLGLVVSKRLAEAMDGSLGAESQLHEGSTFWIELPLAAEPVRDGTASAVESPPDAVKSGGDLPSTLLYIEDNVSNLQVIASVVHRLRPRWRFLSAHDGVKGLEQAREHLPDCILLDLQLPGMQGDAVLAELRASPETRHIPVLMLSADATMPSRKRLLALGANDYLPKPFEIAVLLERLDTLLHAAPLLPS